MDKLITIYHGSKQIVEVPTFGLGRKNNDFGLGFYCTESNDLAKEWAVSSLSDGFSNRYTLDHHSDRSIRTVSAIVSSCSRCFPPSP